MRSFRSATRSARDHRQVTDSGPSDDPKLVHAGPRTRRAPVGVDEAARSKSVTLLFAARSAPETDALAWMSAADVGNLATESAAAIGQVLADLAVGARNERMPWTNRGWHADAEEWLRTTLSDNGTPVVGAIETILCWELSCVLRAQTADGPVYFKAPLDTPLFATRRWSWRSSLRCSGVAGRSATVGTDVRPAGVAAGASHHRPRRPSPRERRRRRGGRSRVRHGDDTFAPFLGRRAANPGGLSWISCRATAHIRRRDGRMAR
jgi:hypothetical protein